MQFCNAIADLHGKLLDCVSELYERIWRGGYPRLYRYADTTQEDYFSAYLHTYITRDVRALTQVGDTSAFMRFMRSVAARSGQQLAYADLARDADVSPNTAKNWLSVLETSGIVDILPLGKGCYAYPASMI